MVQSGSGWLALDDFQDVTFYLEVRLKRDAELALEYETAPSIDPSLFTSMAQVVMSESTAPLVTRVLLSQPDPVKPPLAGLVRWRIVPVTATNWWRVNFRISCLAKRAR